MTIEDREECKRALDLVLGFVRGTLSRGVPTYVEADDLVQECLIRLPDAIRDYRGKNGSSVKTYLKAVIRNDVMDAIKRERREPASGGVEIDTADTGTAGGPRVGLVNEHGQQISRNHAALEYSSGVAEQNGWNRQIYPVVDPVALLTDQQLDVVGLCDLLDVTQEEAAERLGITRNAVASRLRKAHTKLRKAYSDHPVSKRRTRQPK
jgi:RNA polymerase sigma factor (sigma-70 family)